LNDKPDIIYLQEKLDRKTKEVQELSIELEKTNEGLIALYTELDDTNRMLTESNKKLKEEEKKLLSYLFETVNKTRNPVVSITRNLELLEEMTVQDDFDRDDVKAIIEVIKSNAKMINENISELNKVALAGSDRVLDHYREFLTDQRE
jgi:chromosome segregation ATPase